MPRSKAEAPSHCPLESWVVAYLQGELGVAEFDEFRDHLPGCARCRDDVAASRELLASFAMEADAPPVDLIDRVLERLPAESPEPVVTITRPSGRSRRWLAAALLLSGGLLAALLFLTERSVPPIEPSPVVSREPSSPEFRQAEQSALRWLSIHQGTDGSWSSPMLGRDYDIGLTALASLAFLGRDVGGDVDDPEFDRALGRALRYLIDVQRPDGRFGSDEPAVAHNQGITTATLLEAYQRARELEAVCGLEDDLWRASASKALRYLVDHGVTEETVLDPSTLTDEIWTLQAL
ncbi:MAG: hypothetical protein KDC38_20330, partial [Planctomycetes bacterium]|nr:hypothetical protein [Planctomycetota bacterium]